MDTRGMGRALLQPGKYRCPAHDDRTPSLAVKQKPDGKWVVTCFAGCRRDDVLASAGLTVADLYPESPASSSRRLPTPPPPIEVPPCPRGASPKEVTNWEENWRLAVHEARDQEARYGPYWAVQRRRDAIEAQRGAIAQMRAELSAQGDCERTWRGLAILSKWETVVSAEVAECDTEVGRLWRFR